jgi:hypothetical protein
MIRKLIAYTARLIRRNICALWPGAGLLFLVFLLLGCPDYREESYHVYYRGNNHTAGFPPVDSKVYFPGDRATVLDKPEDLKKGDLEFLGWQRSGFLKLYQPGDTINIGYEDVWLYAWWEDDLNYNPYEYSDDLQNGGVIITRYSPFDGNNSDIIIPETLDGKPVTAIGEGVFSGQYLDSVVLPGKLVVIGNKAFAGNWLRNITIPDTVKSIGKLAFQDCSLERIKLGSGLESIDDYAFDNNRLTVLFLPKSVKSVGEGAFSGNEIASIEIGSDVDIKNETSMGAYGASFRGYYTGQKSRAGGVYLYKSDAWKGPYTE